MSKFRATPIYRYLKYEIPNIDITDNIENTMAILIILGRGIKGFEI